MEKVKLPQVVFDALSIVKIGSDVPYDIPYLKRMAEGDFPDTVWAQPIYNWYLNNKTQYFKALVNGYEVEQSPEDKVREQYETPRHFVNKDTDTDADIYRKGIKFALEALNIKIEGVNA